MSGGYLEIADRFWPYERAPSPEASRQAWTYTAKVKQLLQSRACVHSSFSAADYGLAMELHRRQVPLQTVERAIHLGCLHKYVALLNHQGGPLITSLDYFTLLLDEVQRAQVPDQYWSYTSMKLRQLEHRWQASRSPGVAVTTSPLRRNDGTAETKEC